MTDKRAQFFLLAAVACALLWWPAPERFRTLTLVMAGVYVLLALASWLDHVGRR